MVQAPQMRKRRISPFRRPNWGLSRPRDRAKTYIHLTGKVTIAGYLPLRSLRIAQTTKEHPKAYSNTG